MITLEEKEKMWKKVSEEFPSDAMLRDLHFIRELMAAIKRRKKSRTYEDLGLLAREEFLSWLEAHPELAEGAG
ncbi:MAG: hypothetical protein ACE5QW_08095 [Thermoplasmata archaeon]